MSHVCCTTVTRRRTSCKKHSCGHGCTPTTCTTGSVQGWLRTVAPNLLIDKSRKFASQREFADADGPEAVQDDHVGSVLDGLEVVQLLRKACEEQRAVLVHRYLCGRSLQETAYVLGIPEGTVKSRQHYALDTLRKIPR